MQYFSIRFEKRSSWICWMRIPNIMFISALLDALLRHQFALLENNFQNFNLAHEALGEKLSLLFSSCWNIVDSLLASHDSWSRGSTTYVTLCSAARRSHVCNFGSSLTSFPRSWTLPYAFSPVSSTIFYMTNRLRSSSKCSTKTPEIRALSRVLYKYRLSLIVEFY